MSLDTIVACTLANRTIGNRAEGTIESSLVVRLAMTGLMAWMLSDSPDQFIVFWACLALWRTIAGSWNIGSAYHGNPLDKGKSVITNFITKITRPLKEITEKQRRIKGSVQQGIKHLSLLPFAIACGGSGIGIIPFIGFVYYLAGRFVPNGKKPHNIVEYALGAIICIIWGIKGV